MLETNLRKYILVNMAKQRKDWPTVLLYVHKDVVMSVMKKIYKNSCAIPRY